MTIISAKQALTVEGWMSDVQVTVAPDGRIDDVLTDSGAADHHVDMLLPAPSNLHSHSFQRAMAGLTEWRGPEGHDSFWTWRRLMYQYLERLSPDHIEIIAKMVFLEMLEAGYASVTEFHYLHHTADGTTYTDVAEMSARIVAAAEQVGIGLTLLPVLYQWGGYDHRSLEGGQRRFGNDPEQFARLHAAAAKLIRNDNHLGVAPHSLRAVDPTGLDMAVQLAGNGPIHIHVAEQRAEVEELRAHTGARPVEWLLKTRDVTRNWCLIHCTQMTDAETVALAESGAIAGLCPITESSLGDGIFNGVTFAEAGGRFGVGSDSNIQISYFDELRALDYSQRLRDFSRAPFATETQSTGRVLMEKSLQGGAQAAGRESGRIAKGCWADLLAISVDNPWLCNRSGDTALDTLIFGGQAARCVTDVWSAGRHVVQKGRHVQHDTVTSAFQSCVERLGQAL